MDLLYQDKKIFIHGTVSSTEPEFAERVPVTVHAVGSIGAGLDKVWLICLCFSGAYRLENGQVATTINQTPFAGAWIN